jgi:ferredoxin
MKMIEFEVVIDRDRCIGSGNCAYWLPSVFGVDDEGYALVVDLAGASQDDIVAAAEHCPTRAISVERDGQRLV